MLIINGLNVSVSYTKEEIRRQINKKYNFKNDFMDYKILKRSIDARENVKYVLKLAIKLKNENYYKEKYKLEVYKEYKLDIPKSNKKVLVVGYGPAGMFSSLVLAKSGCDVTVVERGMDVDTRIKDINKYMNEGVFNESSNILFGEGGAGMFSDGKLTTGIKSEYIEYIFNKFVEHGASPDILIDSMPHIGSDVLINVCRGIRKEFINCGGKILFNHQLIGFDNKKAYILGDTKEIEFDYIILAIGHSARDTFYMLENKVNMVPKQFSMGVRIEHPQKLINMLQYKGKLNKPATYKLSCHIDGRGCYTFCMCPGGVVVPSNSEKGMINVNGMSYFNRDLENANSAILVDVLPSDYGNTLFGGIEFQRKYERMAYEVSNSYFAPIQRLEDFLNGAKTEKLGVVKPSYKPGYVFANLKDCLPPFVYDTIRKGIIEFDKKLKGYNMPDAILTGVETRSSSPIRIVRDEEMKSSMPNLYPIGEGAGYAGGITSAAVDGIKVAMKIISL